MNPIPKDHLIIHPRRLRILEALAERPRSTYEIAALLPDLALPSLYRHLKALLDGGMIAVQETRRVRGTSEKIYRLAQAPHLSLADIHERSNAEHFQTFSSFIATVLIGFRSYLETAGEKPNLLGDQVGYSEITFYADADEMEHLRSQLIAAIQEVASLPEGSGRQRRKLTLISHPLLTPQFSRSNEKEPKGEYNPT
jgi:DNA-binding transcriptional ArsR family regulator